MAYRSHPDSIGGIKGFIIGVAVMSAVPSIAAYTESRRAYAAQIQAQDAQAKREARIAEDKAAQRIINAQTIKLLSEQQDAIDDLERRIN